MEQTYINIIKSLPVDFTVIDSEGTKYPVSMMVLRGFSPVLDSLMESSMSESISNQITINDFLQ